MRARRILVIDDDPDQQRGLGIRLRAWGYEVITASDAVQAVVAARRECPDLIILDIGLPGGDGHVVLRRLRVSAGTASLPVIVLSAKDPEAHRERMREAGAVAYFQKPAANAELFAAIRAALGDTEP